MEGWGGEWATGVRKGVRACMYMYVCMHRPKHIPISIFFSLFFFSSSKPGPQMGGKGYLTWV